MAFTEHRRRCVCFYNVVITPQMGIVLKMDLSGVPSITLLR